MKKTPRQNDSRSLHVGLLVACLSLLCLSAPVAAHFECGGVSWQLWDNANTEEGPLVLWSEMEEQMPEGWKLPGVGDMRKLKDCSWLKALPDGDYWTTADSSDETCRPGPCKTAQGIANGAFSSTTPRSTRNAQGRAVLMKKVE